MFDKLLRIVILKERRGKAGSLRRIGWCYGQPLTDTPGPAALPHRLVAESRAALADRSAAQWPDSAPAHCGRIRARNAEEESVLRLVRIGALVRTRARAGDGSAITVRPRRLVGTPPTENRVSPKHLKPIVPDALHQQRAVRSFSHSASRPARPHFFYKKVRRFYRRRFLVLAISSRIVSHSSARLVRKALISSP